MAFCLSVCVCFTAMTTLTCPDIRRQDTPQPRWDVWGTRYLYTRYIVVCVVSQTSPPTTWPSYPIAPPGTGALIERSHSVERLWSLTAIYCPYEEGICLVWFHASLHHHPTRFFFSCLKKAKTKTNSEPLTDPRTCRRVCINICYILVEGGGSAITGFMRLSNTEDVSADLWLFVIGGFVSDTDQWAF